MKVAWNNLDTEVCCDKVTIAGLGVYAGSSPGDLQLPGSTTSLYVKSVKTKMT